MASFFNRLLSDYFGLGILLAIILSLVFPYVAYSLSPWGLHLLFLLMYLSGFGIEWDIVKQLLRKPRLLAIGLFLVFIAVPAIVYIFASVLLTDRLYVYGLVFSSLTPTAAVAPFFSKTLRANKELSFTLLVVTMLLAPIFMPFALRVIFGNYLDISSFLLFKDILILVPLPIILAIITKRFVPRAYSSMKSSLPLLNFTLLSLLIFIQFGTSILRLQLNYIDMKNMVFIVVVAFVQDFSLFLFLDPLATFLKDTYDSKAVIVSASMKNIAIASTILLLYSPKAALAPALGFIAHSLLFTPVLVKPLMAKLSDKIN